MRKHKLVLAAAVVLAAVAVPVANAASAEQPAVAATPTDQLRVEGGSAQVVNGQRTTVRENPFVIAGMRAGGGGPQGQSCTASVVGKRKIITAAHCMIDATGAKHYLYGDDDLNTTGDETFRTKLLSFKAHPKYSGTGGWQTGYDVAVVTTEDDLPVPESQWAKVAGSGDSALTQPGKNGTAVGYGRTSANGGSGVLYKTALPVNDANNCQVFNTRVNPDLMVCIGYNDGRTGTCTGDSGGPFTVDGVIVGVVSWGSSGCDRYSIMARLTNEMGDWARSEIGGTPPSDGKFTVALTPSSGRVDPGKYISATVATTAGDQPERLDLSANGQPSGVAVKFQPESVNSGQSAKVTFDVAASAAKGSYPITVTAKGTSGTKTAVYTLTVGDGGSTDGPKPTATPSSATVSRGGSVKATITVAGGTGASKLSATGLSFAPMFFPFSVNPGGSSQMSLFAPFQPGTYKVVITATDTAGKTGQTEFTLTVT
ncbi:trypsin-like serine protease [Actinokineospora diospyrosa]|uniref:Trypsin n=1 Tax=Actinokineospora diospyrosa TaxID=103728 RepID=A0ABT1I5Z7_9PSEU|nr:trypsin-like serine protease [Actinokineospora diospyrosa]MCP2267994.1 Trypsin [Actinokineospora diospyrosa]